MHWTDKRVVSICSFDPRQETEEVYLPKVWAIPLTKPEAGVTTAHTHPQTHMRTHTFQPASQPGSSSLPPEVWGGTREAWSYSLSAYLVLIVWHSMTDAAPLSRDWVYWSWAAAAGVLPGRQARGDQQSDPSLREKALLICLNHPIDD